MTNSRGGVVGSCALCGPDNDEQRVLRDSHFLMRSAYKHFNRAKADNTRLLLSKEGRKVLSLGKQITQCLLCDDCEQLMRDKGEDYAAVALQKIDIEKTLPPPLFRTLHQSLLPIWNSFRPGPVYGPNLILTAGSGLLQSIESEELYHYALGFFWKATLKGWPSCPPMPLDPELIEEMRRFLKGGEFVTGHIVRIVPSFWRHRHMATFPFLVEGRPFFSLLQFDFHLERSESEYASAMAMGSVPLLYTVDSMRSERCYRAIVAHYKAAEQTASSASTELSWLDQ